MNLLKRVAPGFFALLVCVFSPTAFSQKGAGEININGQIVLAARAGLVDRVVALLGEGAKVNSRDRNGDSPLNMAAAKGNLALVDALLKAEADVNLANVAGVTPLMGAAFSGSAGIMQKLIAAGAKIEPIDRVKKNAATYAAGNGCSACLQVLVDAGLQINAPLDNDLTLLMWAAAYGQETSVKLLLAQGANRTLKDGRGKTAADMARDANHLSVAKLIE